MHPFKIGSLKSSSKYDVQFSGLANGLHSFSWEMEPSFFDDEMLDDIQEANLKVNLALHKNERMLNLDFHLFGKAKCVCDRCGDDVWLDIDSNHNLIARFAQETNMTDDEVIFLSPAEYQLDIRQFIFEYTHLSLPVKKVHPKGECNDQVLEYLTQKSDDEIETTETDPRWEALGKLNKNA